MSIINAENTIKNEFGTVNTVKQGGFNFEDSLINSLIIDLPEGRKKCLDGVFYSLGLLNIGNWSESSFFIPRRIFGRVTVFKGLRDVNVLKDIFDPYYDPQILLHASSYDPDITDTTTNIVDYNLHERIHDEIYTEFGPHSISLNISEPIKDRITVVMTNFYMANANEIITSDDGSTQEPYQADNLNRNSPFQYYNFDYRDFRILGIRGKYLS